MGLLQFKWDSPGTAEVLGFPQSARSVVRPLRLT